MKFYSTILAASFLIALAGCAGGGPSAEATSGYNALKAGNYAKARTDLEKAYAKAPNDPYVQLNLGAAYQNTGEMAKARDLFTKVLVSGKNEVATDSSDPNKTGQTLAQIAQANLDRLPAR